MSNKANVLVALILTMLSFVASAQSGCSAEIAEIERRIATGNYPDQNVQVARQLQGSLAQMCAFMDEGTKASMMAGIEDVLPTKSEDEQRAERRANADAAKASRDARKREDARIAAARPAAPAVIKAPPTAKSVAATFVDRNEDMANLWISDWDIHQGKARVLYVTGPSLPQLGRPDWQIYVYVVEITPDGNAVQHMVTSKQAQDNRTVALRRGHDEIIFERHVGDSSQNTTLERWSISGRSLISSVPTPKPDWPDGDAWNWQPFRVATSDGNVLFVSSKGGQDKPSTVGWFEASPGGDVLGMASVASIDERLGAEHFFHTTNGGGGVVLGVTANSDAGIDGSVSSPITREIGGRKVQASVFSETRALVTSDSADSGWESAALSRMLRWDGIAAMPQNIPVDQVMQYQQDVMAIQESTNNELDANRSVDSLNVGLGTAVMIRPMTGGYGALSTVTADRSLTPPIHGAYFLRVNDSGVSETAYLDPSAEELEVDFEILEISPRDDVYVYGRPNGRGDRSYVVQLGADGKAKAYARTTPPYENLIIIEGMTADEAGVWLYGRQTPAGRHQRFSFERIEF